MDRITINGLRVKGRVGVTAEERARAQTLIVNIEIDLDLSAAAASDNLKDTIDYGEVTVEAAAVIRDSQSKLLEPLAAELRLRDRDRAARPTAGARLRPTRSAAPAPRRSAR